MKTEVLKALNEHINLEYASAYLYLNMSVAMEDAGLKGYAHWLKKQWHEELEHAEKMIEFVQRRNEKPELSAIEVLPVPNTKPVEMAQAVLDHEKMVTEKIHELRTFAIEQGDQALEVFLQWYVSEQVEEEANTQEILDMFTIAGDDKALVFTVDNVLRQR